MPAVRNAGRAGDRAVRALADPVRHVRRLRPNVHRTEWRSVNGAFCLSTEPRHEPCRGRDDACGYSVAWWCRLRAVKAQQSVKAAIVCDGCGELFEPTRRDQRHCRPSCRMRAHLNRKAIQRERVCARCGYSFQPHHPDQVFCRLSCEVRWERSSDDESGSGAAVRLESVMNV
jgi:hypothetical protein